MRYLYSPLVSAQQPAFQQSNDAIGQWQKVLTYGRILADHIMGISLFNQAAVSRPVIGPNYAARHHHFWHCFLQTICRSIHDSTKTNTSTPVFILLGGNEHQNFSSGTTATLPRFTRCIYTDLGSWPKIFHNRTVDSENLRAILIGTGNQCRIVPRQISLQIPARFWDIPPCRNTTYSGYESQVHSPNL